MKKFHRCSQSSLLYAGLALNASKNYRCSSTNWSCIFSTTQNNFSATIRSTCSPWCSQCTLCYCLAHVHREPAGSPTRLYTWNVQHPCTQIMVRPTTRLILWCWVFFSLSVISAVSESITNLVYAPPNSPIQLCGGYLYALSFLSCKMAAVSSPVDRHRKTLGNFQVGVSEFTSRWKPCLPEVTVRREILVKKNSLVLFITITCLHSDLIGD